MATASSPVRSPRSWAPASHRRGRDPADGFLLSRHPARHSFGRALRGRRLRRRGHRHLVPPIAEAPSEADASDEASRTSWIVPLLAGSAALLLAAIVYRRARRARPTPPSEHPGAATEREPGRRRAALELGAHGLRRPACPSRSAPRGGLRARQRGHRSPARHRIGFGFDGFPARRIGTSRGKTGRSRPSRHTTLDNTRPRPGFRRRLGSPLTAIDRWLVPVAAAYCFRQASPYAVAAAGFGECRSCRSRPCRDDAAVPRVYSRLVAGSRRGGMGHSPCRSRPGASATRPLAGLPLALFGAVFLTAARALAPEGDSPSPVPPALPAPCSLALVAGRSRSGCIKSAGDRSGDDRLEARLAPRWTSGGAGRFPSSRTSATPSQPGLPGPGSRRKTQPRRPRGRRRNRPPINPDPTVARRPSPSWPPARSPRGRRAQDRRRLPLPHRLRTRKLCATASSTLAALILFPAAAPAFAGISRRLRDEALGLGAPVAAVGTLGAGQATPPPAAARRAHGGPGWSVGCHTAAVRLVDGMQAQTAVRHPREPEHVGGGRARIRLQTLRRRRLHYPIPTGGPLYEQFLQLVAPRAVHGADPGSRAANLFRTRVRHHRRLLEQRRILG